MQPFKKPPYYLSAYSIAVARGFKGTVDEWLESLKGTSAYGLAVEDGFQGSVTDWLASLHGEAARKLDDAGGVSYQVSADGQNLPGGAWLQEVPEVPRGQYLWTRVETVFNTGEPVVWYSIGYMGLDGSGSIVTVNNLWPDEKGNLTLTAEKVGAMPIDGGTFAGDVSMEGNKLTGLAEPTGETDAATKKYADDKLTEANAYADTKKGEAKTYTDQQVGVLTTAMKAVTVTLTADGWTGDAAPYTQTVNVEGMTAAWTPGDFKAIPSGTDETDITVREEMNYISSISSGAGTLTFKCLEDKPTVGMTLRISGVLT